MFRENRVCGFSIDGALRQPQAVLDWRRHPVGKVRPGGRAAGRADIRIVIRNAVGVFGTAKRAARCPVANPPTGPPTLPQRLRGRLGQPVRSTGAYDCENCQARGGARARRCARPGRQSWNRGPRGLPSEQRPGGPMSQDRQSFLTREAGPVCCLSPRLQPSWWSNL